MMQESRKRADALADALLPKLQALGASSELRRLEAPAGRTGEALARACRTADLFVGTRPQDGAPETFRVAEAVLLGSGHACLFVPPGLAPRRSYGTCLVAWNDSREAARAAADAVPLLRQAEHVLVAVVEEHGAGEQDRVEAGTDIGRYMSRHDISAEVRMIAGWEEAGAAILNEARMIGADLIVMGGYGHGRFREWILGGATRRVLSEADVPVLMSH
jgi:nucleotide-binding universal stress UspA family protein